MDTQRLEIHALHTGPCERVDGVFCDPTRGGLHEFVGVQVALAQIFLEGDFDGHGVAAWRNWQVIASKSWKLEYCTFRRQRKLAGCPLNLLDIN